MSDEISRPDVIEVEHRPIGAPIPKGVSGIQRYRKRRRRESYPTLTALANPVAEQHLK
ncbi:MAG: hypothetical protein P8166_08170 [Candidatus Thiodiazotropha sp.]